MILVRILFWFIVFYALFKFVFRVVIPLVITTSKVRSKIKEMKENGSDFTTHAQTHPDADRFATKESTPSAKGDYIDFEEIK
jgi:hypothetical protein